jgi:hypothetical protein
MGQDKPGVLKDWLGSKNRARAESIAKIFRLERRKKFDLSQKPHLRRHRHKTGTSKRQATGTLPAQNGRNFGVN